MDRLNYEKLQHYFRGKVKDSFQAEDLVHDVFIKVMLALPKKQPDDFEAWLFTIAKYTLYDYYRKKKLDLLPEDYEYFLPAADQTLEKITQQERIQQIDGLTEKLRVSSGLVC